VENSQNSANQNLREVTQQQPPRGGMLFYVEITAALNCEQPVLKMLLSSWLKQKNHFV
jgi:hypothetical protein